MAWWYYFVAVPAVVLIINGIPHFVKGITGEKFPTPFSGGPGTLDGAVRNVFWGSGNIIVASAGNIESAARAAGCAR